MKNLSNAPSKLSTAELSSSGYEREVVQELTFNCKNFGAIAWAKSLENEFPTEAELRRRVRARGFSEAQVNQAINSMERYELHEGLLYRQEYDPQLDGFSLSWRVPTGSARSMKILGGRHGLSVRNELIAWYHLSG